ncbi:hypothetical protein H6F89_00065 [Cyanobacteria bacterium FACHB-63]|nr:hypothetical protein [Cyanobacteria bacterium FACHB-63]
MDKQALSDLFSKALESQQDMIDKKTQTAQLHLTADEIQILVDLLSHAESGQLMVQTSKISHINVVSTSLTGCTHKQYV